MAKRPFPGRTKTRLSPPLTSEEAAVLYECFLKDTIDTVRQISGITPCLAYTPQVEKGYFQTLAPDFALLLQKGDSLNERLDDVLRSASEDGYTQVVAINSDSPSLPRSYLAGAFEKLDEHATDVVLGPCEDGGYYLIGWKKPNHRLVRDVKMSTAYVLDDTLTIAKDENLKVSLLPSWYDIDTEDDLIRVRADLAKFQTLGNHTRHFLNGLVDAIPLKIPVD